MGSGVAMLSGPRQTRRGLSPQLRDVCSLGPTAGAVRHPLCVGRSKELIRWAPLRKSDVRRRRRLRIHSRS
jgi:hypothetical protein